MEILCKESRLEALKSAMNAIGITGMTVSHVLGYGLQQGKPEFYRGAPVEANLLPKIQVDIVVSKVPVSQVIRTAKEVLYTGHIGDGKIFVYDVENVGESPHRRGGLRRPPRRGRVRQALSRLAWRVPARGNKIPPLRGAPGRLAPRAEKIPPQAPGF